MKVLMPTTLDQALAAFAELREQAVPIAGGTDLLAHWPSRPLDDDRTFVDLSGLVDLRDSYWMPDALILGALTSFGDILDAPRAAAEMPLLVEAARVLGAVQIQSRATWVGNIANASPAADGVLALMALDATIELTSLQGVAFVPLDAFYTGYKQTRRQPDQLITAVHIPRCERTIQSFIKVGTRRAQAITKVGLAITRSDAGWRIVAGSMAPTVTRCPTMEAMLESQTPLTTPADLHEAICADLSPIDDIRSTAIYRTRVFANILYHELAACCSWVAGGTA
ncbi:Xanthine dehydrogenase, FAD binding subunit [hydrothermal vent metagenome]|uniref:Xanthine dehydrogenase, FAD binding subunit n=1 Tax=hydrothermal vent metagenome TaxID=652676 RepID=A0A3B1DYZ2_9ZZZZ